MAYSPEQWEKAKILFELNIPLSEIEKKTGISKGQISKKANAQNWKKETERNKIKCEIVEFEKKKETLEKEKETLVNTLASMEDFEITIIRDVVEEQTRNRSLLFSTANLSLIRKNQMLTRNKKQVLEFETTYGDDGKPLQKTPIVVDIELSPSDLKAIDEGIDKNAITLDVAPRHASNQVNIQNNQSVEPVKIIREIIDVRAND